MTTPTRPAPRCPFNTCPSNASSARPRVIRHSRMKTRRGWRLRRLCKVCGRTFTATTGTAYHRLRRSKADFDRAAYMQAEGMTKAGVARVLAASPSTVGRWLERAARHANAFHDAHVHIVDAVEVQFDELACHGVGAARSAWVYSAIEVGTRVWAALRVGRRTLRGTTLFARRLRDALGPSKLAPLATSDPFKYYQPVMSRVFGQSIVYVQVHNRYGGRGIIRSDSRQVLGSPLALEYAWERIEDSKRANTAYIERMNLRKRASCSLLRRRNPAPARKPEKVEQALELLRMFYNFVQRHSSLRFGGVRRTPAMQARFFKRPLTAREIFSWASTGRQRWREVLKFGMDPPSRRREWELVTNS